MKRHPVVIRHADMLREANTRILQLEAKLECREARVCNLESRVKDLTASLKRERQINRQLSSLQFAPKQDPQVMLKIRRAIERKNASL